MQELEVSWLNFSMTEWELDLFISKVSQSLISGIGEMSCLWENPNLLDLSDYAA